MFKDRVSMFLYIINIFLAILIDLHIIIIVKLYKYCKAGFCDVLVCANHVRCCRLVDFTLAIVFFNSLA